MNIVATQGSPSGALHERGGPSANAMSRPHASETHCWRGCPEPLHLIHRSRCHHPEKNDMSITAINVRNQFRGKVKEIILGPVVSEIDVETPSGLLVTSVITTRSVKELNLEVGREVIALVKLTEVSIAVL
jgi:molybdopterin-binding protein